MRLLRDYFRKASGFFADHLKRYSKSRRQAPIYWPFSTTSGSYTLWLYYHRLTDQTLYSCVNEFVNPKLEDVAKHIARLQKDIVTGGTTKQAQLPYKPNLNDGVLITASPLYKLFRLPKWCKDLQECWKKLSNGDYDWAHLAYIIWPDRVKDVCKRDPSIAIAHGLEHLCEVAAPKAKSKRKKKSAAVTEEMFEEQ